MKIWQKSKEIIRWNTAAKPYDCPNTQRTSRRTRAPDPLFLTILPIMEMTAGDNDEGAKGAPLTKLQTGRSPVWNRLF